MGAPPRKEIRIESDMMEPLSHHTDAVLCGDFLYLSGAAPLDMAANVIAPGDVVKQCEATCHNIELMLQAADMTFHDIAHFKIFMEECVRLAQDRTCLPQLSRGYPPLQYTRRHRSSGGAGNVDGNRSGSLQTA